MKHNEINFGEDLRCWALKFNIKRIAVNNLLSILRKNNVLNIPKDSRTLLHTPREVTLLPMGAGSYWHCSLKNTLEKKFCNCENDKCISLTFNVDGVQLHESSRYQFWPILCQIYEMPHSSPFVIGIFGGDSKPPTVHEYLIRFCTELQDVITNGIKTKNGSRIFIKIRCFVCDTPARSFIKGKHFDHFTSKCVEMDSWLTYIISRYCFKQSLSRLFEVRS